MEGTRGFGGLMRSPRKRHRNPNSRFYFTLPPPLPAHTKNRRLLVVLFDAPAAPAAALLNLPLLRLFFFGLSAWLFHSPANRTIFFSFTLPPPLPAHPKNRRLLVVLFDAPAAPAAALLNLPLLRDPKSFSFYSIGCFLITDR